MRVARCPCAALTTQGICATRHGHYAGMCPIGHTHEVAMDLLASVCCCQVARCWRRGFGGLHQGVVSTLENPFTLANNCVRGCTRLSHACPG